MKSKKNKHVSVLVFCIVSGSLALLILASVAQRYQQVFLQDQSFAAIENYIEAEQSTRTGPVTVVNDTNSSGGQYLQF